MRSQKLLLLLSQSFLGTGFFFLYVHHARSLFETRTNIAHVEQLERESILRREDALYYSFYKTLTEERDFWTGYEKLMNISDIEYPNSVNVVQRFSILPELTIAYLFHLWRYYAKTTYFPFLSCWRTQDIRLPTELRGCDAFGQAMQFYFEFVWLLGGLTVLVIYSYGTLLSQNIFGGIYAVVSYVMFHGYVAKIYDRPVARENFAFPFILLQMFYLSLYIDRVEKRRIRHWRLYFIFTQTMLTLTPLLCWQFSSVIFASQVLIMMTPWSLSSIFPATLSSLTTDYAISQLAANALAYYFSLGNKKYAFSWQLGPAIGLLCISLVRRVKQQGPQQDKAEFQSIKTVALGMLIATSAQGAINDFLDKTGLTRALDNSYALYRDLIIHWSLQAKISFGTSLAACNPAYERMEWAELWELVKTLVVKPYCLYGVVMLAKFFRKWRKSGENKLPDEEFRERMKKYVLEDFLEDYHVSMGDMSNKETEEELNNCLKLLEECNFDYAKYKERKSKQVKDKENEHIEFMNDIRKLKEKINALNEKKKKDQQEEQIGLSTTEAETEKAAQFDEASNKSTSTTTTTENKAKPSKQQQKQRPAATSKRSASSNNPKRTTNTHAKYNSNGASNAATTATTAQTETTPYDMDFIGFHYIYSLLQMAIFTIVGLCIKKLFFLSFTLGCIIAPTICSKLCFRKQRDIFWTISLTVFLTSIVNPGLVNIREEYYPSQNPYGNDDLDTMLQWIKMNTEKDAVFAGPIDVIGTVHLTTRRPIVNHAHLEMRQNSDRTEYVYSIFSRQQSSDIYNQCSQLKIQYLIISLSDCTNEIRDDCDLLSIWDDMQPAYRKYPQFCAELIHKNIPSFLKVFSNDNYGIIKMFSQSVQINLKRSKMPEKSI